MNHLIQLARRCVAADAIGEVLSLLNYTKYIYAQLGLQNHPRILP
jgi:hypothetical protein